MSYLLDTNVISELVRPKPAKTVLAWFENIPSEALHISVLTLGEIRKGVEQMPDGARREKLRLWLEHDLADWFKTRVLSVDIRVADRWGQTNRTDGTACAQHRQPAGRHCTASRTALSHAQPERFRLPRTGSHQPVGLGVRESFHEFNPPGI
jgi:predicted nucleic acid-binding protein